MGRRGPPKKPVELKLLQGNPGEKKLPKPLKVPKIKGMKPPRELGKLGKAMWRRILPKLKAQNLASDLDVNMLSRYCDTYEHWTNARKFILENGTAYPIYQTPLPTEEELKAGKKPELRYMVQYPQVSQMNQWARDLTRYEQQFGMSPASRTALVLEAPPKASESEIDDLLYGTGH